jgi:hypothetical protein
MNYKLTTKVQHAQHLKNGKRRSLLLYFLNNILIFKQKKPFDEDYSYGFCETTGITDDYLLNGKMYQTRYKKPDKSDKRYVTFPVSKKILSQFEIPTDLKIYADETYS